MTWNSAKERKAVDEAQQAFLALPEAEQDKYSTQDIGRCVLHDTLAIAGWVGCREWAEGEGKTEVDALRRYLRFERGERDETNAQAGAIDG